MNSLKTILILIVLGISLNASAQMKIAHINSGELMEQMPQLKKIQDSLERVSNEYQDVLSAIEAEVTQKQKTWADNPTENKTLLELREKEYQELVSRYQRTQQMAQQDVAKQQEDLLKPLIDDLKNTIIAVAKEMGYDYVLDSTDGGGLIYGNPTHDLMVAVKKKMGIN